MRYESKISGHKMICTIRVDHDISAPIFCFSGMAPMTATKGGTKHKSMGSYTEIALPDLKANIPHDVHIEYLGGHKPANRAWLPSGPYLKCEDEVLKLPFHPGGCHPHKFPELGAFQGLAVVPQPSNWSPTGELSAIRGVQIHDPALQSVQDLARRRGWDFSGDSKVLFKDAPTSNLYIKNDGYEIEINKDYVIITANSYGGRFYAGITLLTLLQHGPLACGTIKDTPRFTWRGQHLDTARHYYQPETILDLLDLMALLKLNRFHWHFADDEAFRLQIECFPELWQKSQFCGEDHLLPALFSGAINAGGSYSKQTAQQIIAHAKSMNIEILPEIEAPAHAAALVQIFPTTRDPNDTGTERSVQGYVKNVLNPAMPDTWDILEKVSKEVADIFPFKHIHLGCDELPEDTWLGAPKARELMKNEGLETTRDLQGWTIEKLAKTVVQNGHRPCAWEEAAQGKNGGIGHNAILFCWTEQGPGLEAARAGYDVVMCPAQHVYLDMAHSSDVDDWGASWAAFISLEDTINWEPVPEPDLADKIIGVQGTFWSEFTTRDEQIWPMLMPRMLGVAQKAWQINDIGIDDLQRLAKIYQSKWVASPHSAERHAQQ